MTSSRSCPFLRRYTQAEHCEQAGLCASRAVKRTSCTFRRTRSARGTGGTPARAARRAVRSAPRHSRVGGWQRACARAMMGHQPKPGSAPMPPCCLPLPSHFMLPFATPHLGQEPAAAGGGVAAGCAPARVSACSGAPRANAALRAPWPAQRRPGPLRRRRAAQCHVASTARASRAAQRGWARSRRARATPCGAASSPTRERSTVVWQVRPACDTRALACGALAAPLRERSQRTHRRCTLAEPSCPAAHSRALFGAEAAAGALCRRAHNGANACSALAR